MYSEENGPKVWAAVSVHDLSEEYRNKCALPNATAPIDDPHKPKPKEVG